MQNFDNELFESLKVIFLNTFLFGLFFGALGIYGIYYLKSKSLLKRENPFWKFFTILLVVLLLFSFPITGCIAGFSYGVHKQGKKYSDTLIKPSLEIIQPIFIQYCINKLKEMEGLSLKQTISQIEKLEFSKFAKSSQISNYFDFPFFNYGEEKFFSTIFETIIVFQAQEMGISKEKIYITKELIQAMQTQENNPKLLNLIYQETIKFWDSLFYVMYLKLGFFLLVLIIALGLDCLIYQNRNIFLS